MSGTHIGEDRLIDFLLGRLGDEEHAAVEEHLDHCSECEQRAAAATPRDPLVGLLSSVKQSDAHREMADGETIDFTSIVLGENSADTDLSWQSVQNEPPRELLNHERYRVIRPLGSGAMGTVWLAEHLVMQRLVAIKVMRPEWIGKAAAVERFTREVRAAAKLKHANIVDAYDAERIGNTLFLVAEYVEGETLAELLLDGPLSAAEACSAIRDAAAGLAHAHGAGVVHRDVKPSNLIRNREGVVKVLDFGLVTAPQGDSSLTGGNMLMGTPDYVAPEQAEDPTQADARSDIYSLGCTLYHLLSGEPPFAGASTLSKLDAHRQIEPRSLDNVPVKLWRVVSRMMAKAPADRFQTAREVVDALLPFCTEDARPVTGAGQRARRSISRLVILVGAGIVVGFVLLFQYPLSEWFRVAPELHTKVSPARGTQNRAGERTIPLLVPTAIGDGTSDDFQVVENVVTMNAMQGSPQVWLNFDVVRSGRMSILAKIRFLEARDDANLKLVFLSPEQGDYSMQIRSGGRHIVLHHADSSKVAVLGDYWLERDFGPEGMDVELRLRDGRMKSVVGGREVGDVSCEGAVACYPCLAVLYGAAELIDPRVVVAE